MNEFKSNVPIYIQVMEDIKMKIIRGTLKAGDKIVSVRELALELGVNPNTIQRALSELEREGFLYTERAVGRYVSDNQELFLTYKESLIQKNIHDFIETMQQIGIEYDDIINYLQKYKEV